MRKELSSHLLCQKALYLGLPFPSIFHRRPCPFFIICPCHNQQKSVNEILKIIVLSWKSRGNNKNRKSSNGYVIKNQHITPAIRHFNVNSIEYHFSQNIIWKGIQVSCDNKNYPWHDELFFSIFWQVQIYVKCNNNKNSKRRKQQQFKHHHDYLITMSTIKWQMTRGVILNKVIYQCHIWINANI